jgi:hypothetical protein
VEVLIGDVVFCPKDHGGVTQSCVVRLFKKTNHEEDDDHLSNKYLVTIKILL